MKQIKLNQHLLQTFIANMSHEIRTPMNAIIGLLQLLRKTSLTPHQLNYVSHLQSSSENLLLIINDILDFSKIEANKLVLDIHPINLEKILKNITPVLSINLRKKNIEFLFDIPLLPECILADGLRLQQVLLNLLSNAIKFTDQGEVIFSVRTIKKGTKKVTLEFSIRDTGIGLSLNQRNFIFNAFSQAESNTTRRFGGTGLGLAISKNLVQLMGGELCVDSDLQIGSNFHFSITCPVAKAKQCQETSRLDHKLLSLKCLLVDDNSSARKIIGDMLRSFGWLIEEAPSGTKAINKILKRDSSEDPFDIVYIDYRMPILDGWATCERIRSLKLKNPIKLILMSQIYDNNKLSELQSVKQNIVDGYLLKPVTPSSVFDSAANIYLSTTTQHYLKPEPPKVPNRLNGLKILLVEDNLTNQMVAFELLVSEGASVIISDDPNYTLNKIKAAEPLFDVVLMDLQMPGMDGYTLTKKIRKKYSKQLLPIIAISATTDEESRTKAIKVGMDDFVSKPFRLDALIETILKFTSPTVISAPPLDFDKNDALSRLGGSQEVYIHILITFIQDTQTLLKDLPESFPKEIDEQFHRTLHTLKGLAATVGANALHAAAHEVYQKIKDGKLNNKQWSQYHRILNKIGLEAIASAQQIIKESAPTPKQSNLLINKLYLFKKLIPYLETNNMKALELYAKLKEQIGIDGPLDEAIERLDFKTAATRCQLLIKQNNEGTS